MGKCKVRQVVTHNNNEKNLSILGERVSEFHAAVIERRLHESNLAEIEKIKVIDRIVEDIKAREKKQ